MTNKKLYISLIIFLTACAIAIITCCIVFAKPQFSERADDSPTKLANDYIHFSYGSTLNIIYGDKYDLTPVIDYEAGECNISYESKDDSILEINENGRISTLKCGSVDVEIMNNNLIIKTVEVNIKPKIIIVDEGDFEVDDLTINTSKKDFKLKILLLNSSDEEVFTNLTPIISTKNEIEIAIKFGIINIIANESGVLHISYPEANVYFEIEINKV